MNPEVDPLSIPFVLSNPWKFPLYGVPLRCSIPLAEGRIRDPARELVLIDAQNHEHSGQWQILSTWDDGSVRFALLNYAVPELPPRTTMRLQLVARPTGSQPVQLPRQRIRVKHTAHQLTVHTGRLSWTFDTHSFAWARAIRFQNRDWLRGQTADLCITDDQGVTYRASAGDCRVSLEEEGPFRVVVRIEGNHRYQDRVFMDYLIRFHFTAGGSQVLMLHHLRNRQGGRQGRQFRRCWLEGALDLGPTAQRRILHNLHGRMTLQQTLECPERVDLDTDIFPTQHKPDRFRFPPMDPQTAWMGPTTLIRNGDSLRETPDEICTSIYEKNPDKNLGADRRVCAPLIDLHEPGVGGLLFKFAMANPEAEFPLHLGSERNGFEIDFFPDCGELHRFGEGMGKTRDVLFNFHGDELPAMDLIHESNNLSYPGVVSPGAAAYRAAGFADLHRTLPFQPNKYPLLESKIDSFRATPHGLQWPLALGWKHFGDEFGARGNLQQKNVWQTINNEEDYLYCCMIDAWRRGQAYDALAMARHVMDIDYIDYSDDPSRSGATCPHCEDHVNGEVYPSHQWCQGLLYFYLATGDPEVLRICKRIGDCLCWWITGPMKQAMRFSGRETAWPLLSLSALYEVTHEPRYRQTALQVVDDLIAIQKEQGTVCWEYPPGSGIYSGYMMPMTFNGIWDVWTATREPRVLQLWKDITQPTLAGLDDPNNWGYVAFRNWQIKVADLTVLARWYELTGDPQYVYLGRNGLRLILAGCPQPDSMFQGFFAMWYRHLILYMKLADEFGLIDDNHCTLVW